MRVPHYFTPVFRYIAAKKQHIVYLVTYFEICGKQHMRDTCVCALRTLSFHITFRESNARGKKSLISTSMYAYSFVKHSNQM